MRQVHTVLDSVAMAYVPLWSAARSLAGVRLCVRAIHPQGVDAAHLLNAIGEDWPEEAVPLVLSLQSPRLLQQALSCAPVRHAWLEVPAPMFEAADTRARLAQASRNGHRLMRRIGLAARRAAPPPGLDLRDCIALAPDERIEAVPGQLVEGLSTQAGVRQALDEAQAWAVAGWPAADVLRAHRDAPLPFDAGVMHQILSVIDDDECSIEYLERLVRQDPVLVLRLLQLVNSAAFGLRREVGSLRHALMMLGFRELGRWVTEHLPHEEPDADLQPVRRAMVMRSRLAHHLLASGSDDMLRAEVYTTAVLAEIDTLLHQPLAELLARLPLNARTLDALLRHSGPYFSLVDVARALGDPAKMDRLPALCTRHEVTLEQANRALLRMLSTSRDSAPRRSERLA